MKESDAIGKEIQNLTNVFALIIQEKRKIKRKQTQNDMRKKKKHI